MKAGMSDDVKMEKGGDGEALIEVMALAWISNYEAIFNPSLKSISTPSTALMKASENTFQ